MCMEETDEDRQRYRNDLIRQQCEREDAYVIHADEQRVQAFRHKVGQLDSLKNLDLMEIDAMRLAQQKKLDELQQMYNQRQGNHMISRKVHESFKTNDPTFQS